jgi:hypothetical protein
MILVTREAQGATMRVVADVADGVIMKMFMWDL